MAAMAEAPSVHTSMHAAIGHDDGIHSATVLSSSNAAMDDDQVDPMEVSPSTHVPMGPPNGTATSARNIPAPVFSPAATGAAAAVQQPKVVQTAFIHKLYNMLEDQTIKHLISWSASDESFLISPSTDFSKVLATYFKHTNISSFVRQLNMYGFHKVSDVFHSGSPDTPLWEFKHGNGNFKRGDLNGLREIKRRSSKHTILHKDSISAAPKPMPQLPIISQDTMINTTEARLNMLEQNLYDLHTRLSISEESNALMNAKCQDLTERLTQSYQHNHDLSGFLTKIVENSSEPLYRDASSMQREIGAQLARMRSDSIQSSDRYVPFARAYDPNVPGSPRRLPYDDRRRASIQTLPRPNTYRPLAPSSHRNNSLSTANSSPASVRGLAPPQPPMLQTHNHMPQQNQMQTPTIAIQPPPYIPRRHTSADLLTHDWSAEQQPPNEISPFAGFPQTQTPTHLGSPHAFGADHQIREKLASYSFGSNNNNSSGNFAAASGNFSRQSSRGPSPPPALVPHQADNNWALPPSIRMPFKDVFKSSGLGSQISSGPPTRRSSMANIQNMLNPVETAETEEEDTAFDGDDLRKRKRLG